MDINKAKQRIEQLHKEIDENRYYYHVLDKPRVSDAVDDSLKRELAKLEQTYPQLVTADSPTQRVGGAPLEKFVKVIHQTPMLSLNDAFEIADLKSWQDRLSRLVGEKKIKDAGYYLELKMDGLAVSLRYKNGIFTRGATRGDGKIGEDVTTNLKTIESIPLKLRKSGNSVLNEKIFSGEIEVRGEIYLPKADFEYLNRQQTKKNMQIYANPRNIAAGSIRQLDPKVAADRNLQFMMYSIPTELGLIRHSDEHDLAARLGFKTNPNNKICRNFDEIEKYLLDKKKSKDNLPYQTDGVVVGVNDRKLFKQLGVVGKAPRGQIAYKFPAEEATSVIRDIVVQIGRTGKLTPVAVLDPTIVAGSTVSRATLHNEDEINRKDIRLGDTVVIRKAGDVIPEVVEPIKRMRTGDEKKFSMPKTCPVCGGDLVKRDGEVDWYCTKNDCSVRQMRQLQHFVSKGAFEIEGLGPKILEKLVSVGLIKDAGDIFALKAEDLAPLERFAEKSADNLIREITDSKKITLNNFIYSLGIRHIGSQMAVDLAKQFVSVEKFLLVSRENLNKMYGVGEKVAESIAQFLSDKKNIELINKMLESGVEVQNYHSPIVADRLKGKTFVVTGVLQTMTREEAHKKITQYGGEFSSSVSNKTNYVLSGENPGSKVEKAKKLGVKIISEEEFLQMLN
jgi:DNA ligase (NAD+)